MTKKKTTTTTKTTKKAPKPQPVTPLEQERARLAELEATSTKDATERRALMKAISRQQKLVRSLEVDTPTGCTDELDVGLDYLAGNPDDERRRRAVELGR